MTYGLGWKTRGDFKPFKTLLGRGYVFDIPASSQQPGVEGTNRRG